MDEFQNNSVVWKETNYIFYVCVCVHAQSLSHVWLCDPMDCSLPDSYIYGISQGRILEWVAISSSRGSSWPRDQTHVSCISCIGFSTAEPLHICVFLENAE